MNQKNTSCRSPKRMKEPMIKRLKPTPLMKPMLRLWSRKVSLISIVLARSLEILMPNSLENQCLGGFLQVNIRPENINQNKLP